MGQPWWHSPAGTSIGRGGTATPATTLTWKRAPMAKASASSVAKLLARTPVIILCGGKGTRLAEETELLPKPMVEIGPYPMLWHIMKYYASFGCRRFVLALGYRADVVKRYFYEYAAITSDFTLRLGVHQRPVIHRPSAEAEWQVTCVDTGVETLKGARLKLLESYIDTEHVMITYGDGIGNVDLRALMATHLAHPAVGTVTGVRPPSRFGELRLEGDHITALEEKPQLTTALINGGFFCFRRQLFEYLSPEPTCDFEFGPLQRLATEDQLRVYRHAGFWQCMDNIREVRYLRHLWETNAAPWRVWK